MLAVFEVSRDHLGAGLEVRLCSVGDLGVKLVGIDADLVDDLLKLWIVVHGYRGKQATGVV